MASQAKYMASEARCPLLSRHPPPVGVIGGQWCWPGIGPPKQTMRGLRTCSCPVHCFSCSAFDNIEVHANEWPCFEKVKMEMKNVLESPATLTELSIHARSTHPNLFKTFCTNPLQCFALVVQTSTIIMPPYGPRHSTKCGFASLMSLS